MGCQARRAVTLGRPEGAMEPPWTRKGSVGSLARLRVVQYMFRLLVPTVLLHGAPGVLRIAQNSLGREPRENPGNTRISPRKES